LINKGVQFLQDTLGNEIIAIEDLKAEDIVIIPAFGTTIEIENRLSKMGIEPHKYNSTCPFVERVWNKAEQIGEKGYSIIIHGKPNHEETRATFSHSKHHTPSVVVKDMKQTIELAKYITGEKEANNFYDEFKNQYSAEFDVSKDLQKIGVVNQTTMLASDTQAISDYLKSVMIKNYSLSNTNLAERFADTRDTLCYATNDNQTAVRGMLEHDADFAIVVGGYNSSNTSHLVELCEAQLPTFYISNPDEIISESEIQHFNFHQKKKEITYDFIPTKKTVTIMLTSGASCPDAVVEAVIEKIISFVDGCKTIQQVI
jgi:4-hydroxy-3-methylbut-2-enyl diphosphate reductase